MDINNPPAYGTLSLSLHEEAEVSSVNVVVAVIRRLPEVVRVQVDLQERELEILFKQPSEGFLRKIHTALVSARADLSASRTR